MANDIIQIDYESMEVISDRFLDQADLIEQMVQMLRTPYAELHDGGWAGQAADAFFNEYESELMPVIERLSQALSDGSEVTRQIIELLRDAEEEAANQLSFLADGGFGVGGGGGSDEGGGGFFGSVAGFASASLTGGFGTVFAASGVSGGGGLAGGLQSAFGWLGDKADDVGDWVVENRNEVALGAAIVGAGILTVATGGAASPLLVAAVGAGIAGGTTLAINANTPQYTLWDGVVSNTISGAFAGYGVGSAGAAISAMRGITVGSNWAAMTGAASSQATSMAGLARPLTYGLTYAPHVLNAVGGGSMAVSAGGFDILIPDQYESTVHTVSNYVGAGSAVANLGLAVGGNQLIRHAFANPRMHPPGGSMVGTGNSRLFQSHHLYPQNQFGQLNFPANVLDDTVLLPTGPISRGSFIPNLHTGPNGIHSLLRNSINPNNLTQSAFQAVNQQFMNSMLTGVTQPIANVAGWGGLIGLSEATN